jgi:sugar/nucleoside kinase (ribokinase family)
VAECIDILGLGAVAVDDLIFLEEFPRPDTKVRVVRHERHAGGLTGTALVAAARMGCRSAYAGTLGEDELSRFIADGLAAEGVSIEWIVRQAGARPYRSTIIVDMREKTRTILSDSTGVIGADTSLPEEPLIVSSRVLFVDHTGLAGMMRAARIARRAGIPVVADFEQRHAAPFDELFALSNHLILPLDFACEITGVSNGRAAAEALWDESRAAVVVTMGAEGSWFLSSGQPLTAYHQQAFPVPVVDTTGCGDVFHGVYAACLSRGMTMAERVRFASAAAAIKATRVGGQEGIPSCAEVEAFLKSCERVGRSG